MTKDALVEGAHRIAGEVKLVAGDAAAQVRGAAETKLEAGRDFAAEHLFQVAHALRRTGDELRSSDSALTDYVTKAATSVDEVSHYLQTRTLSQLLGDAEGFARREPAMFLGGSFLAGLLGGRFLKSATPATGNDLRGGSRSNVMSASAKPALPAYAADRHSTQPWRTSTPLAPSPTTRDDRAASTSSSEGQGDARATIPNKVNGGSTNGNGLRSPQAGSR